MDKNNPAFHMLHRTSNALYRNSLVVTSLFVSKNFTKSLDREETSPFIEEDPNDPETQDFYERKFMKRDLEEALENAISYMKETPQQRLCSQSQEKLR